MESLQKIVITTGDQHFDGFKHNCSHKKHISTWKLLSVKCLRELRQAKVTNSFMRKTSYHKKISVFTFLDVNLVLYVQSDFHIPLHLCSHEKKIFSGLIVKNCCEYAWIENIFMHALWHNKTHGNIYLNREKCELLCI